MAVYAQYRLLLYIREEATGGRTSPLDISHGEWVLSSRFERMHLDWLAYCMQTLSHVQEVLYTRRCRAGTFSWGWFPTTAKLVLQLRKPPPAVFVYTANGNRKHAVRYACG